MGALFTGSDRHTGSSNGRTGNRNAAPVRPKPNLTAANAAYTNATHNCDTFPLTTLVASRLLKASRNFLTEH